MNLEVDQNEAAMIMDGLSALPLARSYNLFNKLAAEFQKQGQVKTPAPLKTEAVEELKVQDGPLG